MTELHRLPGENEEQFIWRLGRAKDSGELDMDWEEVANIKTSTEFRAHTGNLISKPRDSMNLASLSRLLATNISNRFVKALANFREKR